jgi:hypothetical protein
MDNQVLFCVPLVLTCVSLRAQAPSDAAGTQAAATLDQERAAAKAMVDPAVARAREASAAAARARDEAKEARDEGRALLDQIMNNPGRAQQAAEALGVLASAAGRAEDQAQAADDASRRVVEASERLATASQADLSPIRDGALAAAIFGEQAASAATSAAALALKAKAELVTRAAGAEAASYPDPWYARILPFTVITGVVLLFMLVIYLAKGVQGWWRSDRNVPAPEGDDERLLRTVGNVQWWMIAALMVGVGVTTFWLVAGGRGPQDASAELGFVLHLGTGGAAAVLGGLLGFLFGIPRTPDATTISPELETDTAWRTRVSTNTGLERISTWLTTLLLGATLIQFGSLSSSVWRLAGLLSGAGPGDLVTPSRVFSLSLMIYYFGVGFLGLYLLTRLYLTYALALAVGRGRFGATETVEGINARLDEGLKPEQADLAVLRVLLDRGAKVDGALQRRDHLLLRLRALARLHQRAAEIKADRATIRQEAVRDLERLERAARGWGNSEDQIRRLLADENGPLRAAFGDDPSFQRFGLGPAAVGGAAASGAGAGSAAVVERALQDALRKGSPTELQAALKQWSSLLPRDQTNSPRMADLAVRAAGRFVKVANTKEGEAEFERMLALAKPAFALVADEGARAALKADPDVASLFGDQLP